MRFAWMTLLLVYTTVPALAREEAGVPTSEKAQKTYQKGVAYLRNRMPEAALASFTKADKQDDGRCLACQREIAILGLQLRKWEEAENAAEEMVAQARVAKDAALAHYQLGMLLFREGIDKHQDDFFARAHDELTKALAAAPNFPDATFLDGQTLAYRRQDDAARAQFDRFAKMKSAEDPSRQRALLFIERPELARARMAPAFTLTTLDGQRVSMDELQGKVVLLDFWATWCGPCREALPHVREIARKFEEQPLVILSVSLDQDEQKWRDFVQKNVMTWPQYRDGGFGSPMATLFGVHTIPHTFTIDADGVLQDERIGDASIEWKLKKLITQATESQAAKQQGH